MNLIGFRNSQDGPRKVRALCLRCQAPMWVGISAFKAIDAGVRPFCDGCVAVDKLVAESAGIIVITEAQLDLMLTKMRRKREIVQSN